MTALLVVAGAVLAAPLRLGAVRWAARTGRDPAVGILAVNVVGSALLGALLGVGGLPSWVLALAGAGFCGTLTTFSTFGADVVRLARARELMSTLAYVVATLVLGVGAAAAGYLLTSSA